MNNPKVIFPVFMAFLIGGIGLSSVLLTTLLVIKSYFNESGIAQILALILALQIACAGYVTFVASRWAKRALRMESLQNEFSLLQELRGEIEEEHREVEGESLEDAEERKKSKLKQMRRVLRAQEKVLDKMTALRMKV